MKKRLISLLAAAALTLGLSVPALAAEDPGIQVQLDGQALTFTDAKPQVKDNRTFLPYRAVFEAMGATVSSQDSVITAVRGDTTLTMTIGATTATLVTGNKTQELTMDVAPYVDNATWRTYVPVRFAADAFGCNVGWDQATQTAIIVDVETLTQGLLTGETYTILNKYLDYTNQFNQGSWASEGTMKGSAILMGNPAMTFDGTMSGLTADSNAADMALTMNMDMTGMMTTLAAMQGVTPADLGITAEQMKMTMDMAMKMDMSAGQYYFQYGDELNAQLGLPAGAWLSMDLGATLAQSGIDLESLKQFDLNLLVKTSLATYDLNGKSAGGYTELVGIMNTLSATLSDEGFKKVDGGYETDFALNQDGTTVALALTLPTDKSGKVIGYSMKADVTVALPEELTASLSQSGIQGADKLTLTLDTAMDAKNLTTLHLGMGLGQLLVLNMDMECTYTATDKVPATALPEGAVVVDFNALLAGMMASQTPDQA